MPLGRPQWLALLAAAIRELGWGLRLVSREVRHWRELAARIPDPDLRRDALHALDHKRGHTDGAAMFWTLPKRRNVHLLRLLVRYELLQDFLDSASEPGGALGPDDGAHLYLALADALDVDRPRTDYYRHHPDCRDGGYLAALVDACRAGCRALPSYRVVRPLLIREAERAEVLVLNHEPVASARDRALRGWARRHFPGEQELIWYELTAAASGWITTHALLALAARPAVSLAELEATYAAYFPWLALTLTLIDSYVDQAEDRRNGAHNYFDHYADPDAAVRRLRESVGRASAAVGALPRSERHTLLLGCMIALYLSKDSARTPALRATTASIVAVGGTLPKLLMPALRAWRICNAQSSST